MEENNNNPNAVEKTIKEAGNKIKQTIKQKTKKIIIQVLIQVLPILLGILLAAGVLLLIPLTIRSFFDGILGLFTSVDEPSTVAGEVQQVISIDKDTGAYVINSNFSEQILDNLESKNLSTEAAGLLTGDIGDLVNKYIEAEVKTMYPQTGVTENQIDGLIKIQRASAETGTTQLLEYKKYSEFCEMANNQNEQILNYFSLNPDTYELCLATSEITRYYDKDGNEINSKRQTKITQKEVNYQTAIENYATPFNFFIALHVIAQDENFMNDIVNLVVKNLDSIYLTIIETTHVETSIISYSGSQETKTTVENSMGVVSNIQDSLITINNDNIESYYGVDYFKKEITTNTGSLHVTQSKTWLLKKNQKIVLTSTENRHNGYNEKQVVAKSSSEETPMLDGYTTITKTTSTFIWEETNMYEQYKNWSTVETNSGYYIDDFMDLIDAYPKVKNNIKNAPSMLFYMLEEHENTQQLEKVMKYIIYMMTSKDYGVTDLGIFEEDKFVDIDTGLDTEEVSEILSSLDLTNISAERKKLIEFAISCKGKFKYRMGGKPRGGPGQVTVGSALDCSGFIQYCYWSIGKTFTATNTYNYSTARDLIEIEMNQIKPGDLQVMFAKGGESGHVRMFIGESNGKAMWAECCSSYGTNINTWSNEGAGMRNCHYFTYPGI